MQNIINKIKAEIISRLWALKQNKINRFINKTKQVTHNNIAFKFFVPNPLSLYRVKTFSTKEPDTLSWIDSLDKSSILWDIGANIGLYSIYAAKSRNTKVFAFEPSVFNLEFLAKNIHINRLQNNIIIFPVALSDKSDINLFKMNSPLWGGALSSFGVDYDQHGENYNSVFEYSVPGLKADNVCETFNIPKPDYIKIDVDGIEHLILNGAEKILKEVKSVLIEIDDNFLEQSEKSKKYLSNAGLVLKEKHSLSHDGSQFNQLWARQ